MIAVQAAGATPAKQVILVGNAGEPAVQEFLQALYARFIQERVVLLVDSPDARAYLAAFHPEIAAMDRVDGKPAAYVCENFACRLPTTDVAQLTGSLTRRRASGD